MYSPVPVKQTPARAADVAWGKELHTRQSASTKAIHDCLCVTNSIQIDIQISIHKGMQIKRV